MEMSSMLLGHLITFPLHLSHYISNAFIFPMILVGFPPDA